MNALERLALAIHEATLGERCKARGAERQKHIAAYRRTADELVERLTSRPPEDAA